MMDKFIVGFGGNKSKYTINGVKYIVESRYVPVNIKNTNEDIRMDNRLEKYLKSDFADLPFENKDDKITVESMCSAAGKEDNNAVEN